MLSIDGSLDFSTVQIYHEKYDKIQDNKHTYMGESSKFPKSWTFENQIFKLAGWLQKWII